MKKIISLILAFCMIFSMLTVFAAAAPVPDDLTVEYNLSEATISVGETVLLIANCQFPEGATNVKYQWYVAEAPNHWGEPIYGETTDTYEFCGGMEETLYFRCQISCEVGGVVIGTRSEEFDTIRVNVTYAGPPSMFFDDVKVGDWFYEDVEYVYYSRLMNGISDKAFGPNISTTRGMIVTILHRMEGTPVPANACPFTDVAKGSYYEAAIAWAAENDIVNGVGNGKFAPDDKITREQLAAIFFRYAKYAGIYNEDDCVMTGGFNDQNKVSPWAQEAMSWAIGVGLIGGSNESDGLYLLPQGNALRCQVAAILHRFCEYFEIN